MNWAALGEFILAVLTTQMDALRRILDTTDLTMKEFRWTLIPPLLLLGLWELGKFLARRQARTAIRT
jgi:Ca2+-transporting ATPase